MQEHGGGVAALAHLAVDEEGPGAEAGQALAQLLERGVHAAGDGAGGVLGLGAHVEQGPAAGHDPGHLVGLHHVALDRT